MTASADFPSVSPLLTGPSGKFLFHLSPDGATVTFSTLVGSGQGPNGEGGLSVVVDATGGATVGGIECGGTAIVTAGAFQPAPRDVCDGFVLRVSASGAVVAGTYLGGTRAEEFATVALGLDGSVYLAGTTRSSDLPTTPGAFQQTRAVFGCPVFRIDAPCRDGFVGRLSPSLTALQYLTYLRETDAAGAGDQLILALAVGPSGDAYVTGTTNHSRFPTTPAAYRVTCVNCVNRGVFEGDAFVTRLNASGTGLVYSTYLGGANRADPNGNFGQSGLAIALDAAGRAYVGGRTFASDFPLLHAVQPGYTGVQNAFVSRLNPDGTLLDFSTTLGPGSNEQATALAVSGATVWIGGSTSSTAFPTTPDALQPASGGGVDGFVMALDVPGNLQGTGPLVWIDIPVAGTEISLPFEIGGWAIDRGAISDSGIDAVHVYAFPATGAATFLGAAPLGFSRPDVAAAFGPQFDSAGWLMKITSMPSMPEGPYTLVAFAHSAITGRFDAVVRRSVRFPVPPTPDPLMSIDAPAPSSVFPASATVFIGGWAIDRSAATGPGIDAIHVWIYPTPGDSAPPPFFAGVATYGVSRPDVGAAFGSRFTPSGYQLYVSGLAPGTYAVYVYAHSTVSNTFVINAAREFRIQ
jgi:hypothetical protein